MISWMGVSRSGGGGRGPTTQGTYPTAVSINYYARVSTDSSLSCNHQSIILQKYFFKYQMIVQMFCFYMFTYTNCINPNAIFYLYLPQPPVPPPPKKKKKACMV